METLFGEPQADHLKIKQLSKSDSCFFCLEHYILLRLCKPEHRMSKTIKVLCYKSKTLSNGEHPLMLCVCKDRKRKFQSLGISIKAELWDFKTNQPKDKCPNRERIANNIFT